MWKSVSRWRKGNISSMHALAEESLAGLCFLWKMVTVRESSSFGRKFVLFVSVFPTGAFVCDKQKLLIEDDKALKTSLFLLFCAGAASLWEKLVVLDVFEQQSFQFSIFVL